MGKASSAKKVARIAQKGKGRKVRFQGGTLFPAVMVGLSILGLVLIVYSRASIPNTNTPPTVDDHWHVAYGFNVCGSWLPDLQGNKEELDSQGQLISEGFRRTGIHSHDDGIMHWHPYTSAATGRNAKLGVFLDVYDVNLGDSKIEFPDEQGGALYEEGTYKCEDADGSTYDAEIAVYAFDSFDDEQSYQTYITNFDDIRIKQDAMAITISFNKPGWTPVLPPKAAQLPQLGAADNPSATTTTVAGATTLPGGTTIPGETTTTVPGATTTTVAGGTSTTVAGATTSTVAGATSSTVAATTTSSP